MKILADFSGFIGKSIKIPVSNESLDMSGNIMGVVVTKTTQADKEELEKITFFIEPTSRTGQRERKLTIRTIDFQDLEKCIIF